MAEKFAPQTEQVRFSRAFKSLCPSRNLGSWHHPSFSGDQSFAELMNLGIDLVRVGDGAFDLFTDQQRVLLAQAMDHRLYRTDADLQRGGGFLV